VVAASVPGGLDRRNKIGPHMTPEPERFPALWMSKRGDPDVVQSGGQRCCELRESARRRPVHLEAGADTHSAAEARTYIDQYKAVAGRQRTRGRIGHRADQQHPALRQGSAWG